MREFSLKGDHVEKRYCIIEEWKKLKLKKYFRVIILILLIKNKNFDLKNMSTRIGLRTTERITCGIEKGRKCK